MDVFWKKRSIVWLAGVRRAGKTHLCRSLPRIEYFDCELPRTRRTMDDPEGFLESLRGKGIVLDEIHRLENQGSKDRAARSVTSREILTNLSSST